MTCILCGSNESRKVVKIENYTVVKCISCQFVYTVPLPDEEEIIKIYKNSSAAFRPGGGLGRRLKYRFFAKRIKSYFPKHKHIKLLEIGCNQGDFLEAVNYDEKFSAIGIDLDNAALQYAKSLHLDVLDGTLENQNFPDEIFDCVVALHVVEHLHNPVRTLAEIHRVLADGGIFVSIVPCVTHIKARIKGIKWKYYGPPGHLWYFSPKTFRLLLNKTGFNPIRVSCFYDKAHLKAIAKKEGL